MGRNGKRIFVLCDLEGVSGVVNWGDTGPGPTYQRSLRLATEELNALLRGLRAGGAEEIAVLDGHGGGGLDPELVTEECEVRLGRPIRAPYGMDEGWDGVVYFAHHSMAGTPGGHLCHSWSHETVVECTLKGEPIGEIGWYIYLAGYFGARAMLVTGDDKACAEAERYAAGIEKAVVKKGVNTTTALCRPPQVARAIIEDAARRAMKRLEEMEPPAVPKAPYLVTCRYIDPTMAEEYCAARPWARRVDARTVAIEADDYLELSKRFL